MTWSEILLSIVRSTRRAWPFALGRDLPNRAAARVARWGLLKPGWFQVTPGIWMKLNITDLIQETILLEGEWDPLLTRLITHRLKPGQVFIDVGAHIGYFSLLAARRVAPGGIVLSLEPNPFALGQLKDNMARSGITNIILRGSACSATHGPMPLHLYDDSNSSRASLSRANAGGEAVLVAAATLDSVVEECGLTRVDFIKIDVEGAELLVLRGMPRILRDFRPVMVLELDSMLLAGFGCDIRQVRELLAAYGYDLAPLGGHSNYAAQPREAWPA